MRLPALSLLFLLSVTSVPTVEATSQTDDNVKLQSAAVVKLRIHRTGRSDETAAGIYVGKDQQNAYFVTAYHAIEPANNVQVQSIHLQFDSSPQQFEAHALDKFDPELDLGVVSMAVVNLPSNIPRLRRQDVVPGMKIHIIGHPSAGDWSVWPGNIQNENGRNGDPHHFSTTRDSSLAGGYSGGPVFGPGGNFLGMHTETTSQYGISLKSREILDQLAAWRIPVANVVESSLLGGLHSWQRVAIKNKDQSWQFDWRDISWNYNIQDHKMTEGWLGGAREEGGGGGPLGRGILLHTTDGGENWTEIDREQVDGERGKFRWGGYEYSWQGMGPINAIMSYSRILDNGGRRTEVWLAATSGIYFTEDDGNIWNRSTPKPDDPATPQAYAIFLGLSSVEAFREIYAVGWQGIAHWSSSSKRWNLQLPTYSYAIMGIYTFGTDGFLDIWAVGHSPTLGKLDELIYHLKQPEETWERFPVTGIDLEPGDNLRDIRIFSSKEGLAVGTKGAILKGEKKDGKWTWTSLSSPTKENLGSIAEANGTWWIVGDKGVVLCSRDDGQSWSMSVLTDSDGKPSPLKRIRFFADNGWILGTGVVYKVDGVTPETCSAQSL